MVGRGSPKPAMGVRFSPPLLASNHCSSTSLVVNLIMRQGGLAPILIIIIIAFVAGLGYWGYRLGTGSLPQPETASTESGLKANWKTYTYNKCEIPPPVSLSFSYQIPSSWKEAVSTNEDYSSMSTYSYIGPGLTFRISCGVGFGGAGPACGDEGEFIQDKFEVNGKIVSGCLETYKKTNTLILRWTYAEPDVGNENKPQFEFSAEGKDTPENRQLINQILSTFKFTQ